MLLSSHRLLRFCHSPGWKEAATGGGSDVVSSFSLPFYPLYIENVFLFPSFPGKTSSSSHTSFYHHTTECVFLLSCSSFGLIKKNALGAFLPKFQVLQAISVSCRQHHPDPRIGAVLTQPITTIAMTVANAGFVLTVLGVSSHSLPFVPRFPELITWERPWGPALDLLFSVCICSLGDLMQSHALNTFSMPMTPKLSPAQTSLPNSRLMYPIAYPVSLLNV